MFSFDLRSGYNHVDVAEAHKFNVFTVLPFGQPQFFLLVYQSGSAISSLSVSPKC